jgi:hypothetical protein
MYSINRNIFDVIPKLNPNERRPSSVWLNWRLLLLYIICLSFFDLFIVSTCFASFYFFSSITLKDSIQLCLFKFYRINRQSKSFPQFYLPLSVHVHFNPPLYLLETIFYPVSFFPLCFFFFLLLHCFLLFNCFPWRSSNML